MDDSDLFRTFCHISDYGEAGYANLHRLIATSSPLVLWAPSSTLLRSPGCRVTEKSFVKHVEAGRIRIIGRREWLLDKRFRDSHPWSGGAWNTAVDDAIRAMALNDENEPAGRRRVTICPDEQGLALATEYVERHPDVIETLHAALTAPEASHDLPIGLVQHALRYDEPRELAINVLRPAYNHAEAIDRSGARAPFLLLPKESRFHELMSTLQPAPDTTVRRTDAATLADLTAQVVDLVRHMERLQGSRATLDSFVKGEGHALLTKWLSSICAEVAVGHGDSTEGVVLRRLQEDFDRERLRDDWSDLVVNREGLLGGAGLSSVLVEVVTQQLGVFSAIGLATGAVQVGHNLLQKTGHLPVTYEGGSQWPFLYAFGKPASRHRRARLGRLLDDLAG